MSLGIADLLSVTSFAVAVILPVWLVVIRRKFWSAVILVWALLVLQQGLLVFRAKGADTTQIGLVFFTGWMLALPYCGILMLGRIALEKFGLLERPVVEKR